MSYDVNNPFISCPLLVVIVNRKFSLFLITLQFYIENLDGSFDNNSKLYFILIYLCFGIVLVLGWMTYNHFNSTSVPREQAM